MKNQLISVIVPVYKAEQYLNRCIESIVNQTYKNLEIILVEDGSPDNSGAICDKWAEKDCRIKVIHKKNGGVSSARNMALDKATGDYFAFVDSDDYLEHNMIEFLLNQLLKNNADISVCDYQVSDEVVSYNQPQIVTPTQALEKICVGDYKYGVLWNKLYKKDLFNGVRFENLVCCEDMVANYFVFKKADTIVESNAKLYHYFQNENSTVHRDFDYGSFDSIRSKEIIIKQEQGSNLYPYALRGLIVSCFVALSGIISSQKCLDKYDIVREYIVKNRKTIYKSNLYSKRDKIKVFVLTFFPKLYNHLI